MQGPQVLLALQEAPAVTGTATFEQAAASWAATASERFTSTAAFVQAAATWDAAALERLTATASWVQTQSWDATAQVANPVSASATWEQTQSWEANAAEKFTSTASFAQAAAAWDTQATESIPSTATWSQDASWAAIGLSAEDVLADATWEQAAASWLAASTQVVTGSGTWEQANIWLAALSERIAGTASWAQGQSWDGAGDVDNPPTTGTGEWTQAPATWSGFATTPSSERPRFGLPVGIRLHTDSVATFSQAPAVWAAEMNVVRRDADIEELLLVGAL
ncbi:MAG TPA: hypothetical protein VJT72_07780 [Pseudonocardiaceae bacterium]|nr:hypothetical protein [Pseudonocardiaceae bacterium]